MLLEWIRNNDGVVEHASYTVNPDNTVVVSADVMAEIMMGLGFKVVDVVTADVIESETTTTEG